jgi:hypothetical protein
MSRGADRTGTSVPSKEFQRKLGQRGAGTAGG